MYKIYLTGFLRSSILKVTRPPRKLISAGLYCISRVVIELEVSNQGINKVHNKGPHVITFQRV